MPIRSKQVSILELPLDLAWHSLLLRTHCQALLTPQAFGWITRSNHLFRSSSDTPAPEALSRLECCRPYNRLTSIQTPIRWEQLAPSVADSVTTSVSDTLE